MNPFQLAASPSNPRAQSLTRHIVQVLAFTLAFGAPALCSAGGPTKVELSTALRKLWEDHFTWTRLYIVSASAGLPDQEQTAHRLLQNQADIGNAIKPFYGDAAVDKLTALLKDHILIATEVISAAKAGDSAKLADAKQRWYATAMTLRHS